MVIFLCVPFSICYGLYITKNPWCLLGLAFCYNLKSRSKDKNKQYNVESKIEEN